MRKWMSGLALAVALVAAAGVAQAQVRERCGSERIEEMVALYQRALAQEAPEQPTPEAKPKCDGSYGTEISWLLDEKRAADKARTEKKLVLIVHLSGELDDAEKT